MPSLGWLIHRICSVDHCNPSSSIAATSPCPITLGPPCMYTWTAYWKWKRDLKHWVLLLYTRCDWVTVTSNSRLALEIRLLESLSVISCLSGCNKYFSNALLRAEKFSDGAELPLFTLTQTHLQNNFVVLDSRVNIEYSCHQVEQHETRSHLEDRDCVCFKVWSNFC